MRPQTTYATPFDELFRRLTPAERRELTDSIRANGVRVPITVYQSAKHGPAVIDGANRLAICTELGIECPVNDLGEMSDRDAKDLAEQLNLARRNLSPKDWRIMASARANRIKRVAEKRKEGKSLRTIADEEGVSAEQIRNDIKDAGVKGLTPDPVAGGDVSPPETESPPEVKGKDGKTYKATKPKPIQPAPAPAPPPSSAPRPAPPPPAPDPAPVDDSARLLHALTQQLTETAGLLSALAANPASVGRKIDVTRARRLLDELNEVLRGG